jgi:hypothetical protein
LYGSSAACETFGNLGLASTEDFVVKNVEVNYIPCVVVTSVDLVGLVVCLLEVLFMAWI